MKFSDIQALRTSLEGKSRDWILGFFLYSKGMISFTIKNQVCSKIVLHKPTVTYTGHGFYKRTLVGVYKRTQVGVYKRTQVGVYKLLNSKMMPRKKIYWLLIFLIFFGRKIVYV